MEVAIFIYILLLAHLKKDKSFSQNTKTVAYVVFGVLGVWYLLFRIIF